MKSQTSFSALMLLIMLVLIGAIIYVSFFWPETATKVTERTIDWNQTRMSNLVIYGERNFPVKLKAEEIKARLPLLGLALKSSRIIIVGASCQAGIDYKENPPDVKYDQNRSAVKITVEDVKLLNCRPLGVEYIDSGGLVPASTELSNQLYAEAMSTILADAEESDLLEKARESAAMELELEARRFGFEEVEIIFVEAPEQ